MAVINGQHPLVSQFANALGLPSNIVSFELRCAVDELVTIKCEYLPTAKDVDVDAVRLAMTTYQLIAVGGSVDGAES